MIFITVVMLQSIIYARADICFNEKVLGFVTNHALVDRYGGEKTRSRQNGRMRSTTCPRVGGLCSLQIEKRAYKKIKPMSPLIYMFLIQTEIKL